MPAEIRRRSNLVEGQASRDRRRGDALANRPGRRGGLPALLFEAIEASGGYAALAAEVAADGPDSA